MMLELIIFLNNSLLNVNLDLEKKNPHYPLLVVDFCTKYTVIYINSDEPL